MKPWVTTLGCIVFVANLLFMIFWFSIIRLEAVIPRGQTQFDVMSLQMTMLGIMLAAMAIGLGIASIFGYQALHSAMLAKAEELVNQRFQNPDARPGHEGPPSGGGPVRPTAPAGGPAAIQEEQAKL